MARRIAGPEAAGRSRTRLPAPVDTGARNRVVSARKSSGPIPQKTTSLLTPSFEAGHSTEEKNMSKRKGLSLVLVCLAALVAAMLAVPARAQQEEQTLYTYVAAWGVPRAQWNDF